MQCTACEVDMQCSARHVKSGPHTKLSLHGVGMGLGAQSPWCWHGSQSSVSMELAWVSELSLHEVGMGLGAQSPWSWHGSRSSVSMELAWVSVEELHKHNKT